MSRRCNICGRKPQTSIKRSHSHIATKTRQFLNLQTKRINGKKLKICTRCIKTQNKPVIKK